MKIKFIKIPNKYGVRKEVLIKDLTFTQIEKQINICEAQFPKIEDKIKELKKQNYILSKSLDNKDKINENVKELRVLLKNLEFFESVYFTITNVHEETIKNKLSYNAINGIYNNSIKELELGNNEK